MKKTVLNAPDGGYGWIIVVAAAFNNFIAVSITSGFGLILISSFEHLGLSATEGSFIINLNSGFGMLAGLVNGPLLNSFGYRKISLVGSFFMSVGVFCLTFADNMTGFVLAYGLMASMGVALTKSSYTIAISTYFTHNRNKAFSITMAISGLGSILLPQVLDILLEYFDTKGALLVLSAIYAQTFIAATLLQPVKYHMKKEIVPVNMDEGTLPKIVEEDEDDSTALGEELEVLHDIPKIPPNRFQRMRSNSYVEVNSFRRKDSTLSMSYEQEIAGIYGLDSSLIGASRASMSSLEAGLPPVLSKQNTKTKFQWWRSASTVNLESSLNIFDVDVKDDKPHLELSKQQEPVAPVWKRVLTFVVEIFDLTLMKDFTYCSIMIGISLTVFAEIDFSVSLAFILSELGMTTSQIAEFLSIMGIADILFRFLACYIGDILNQPPRIVHLFSLTALIVVRSFISVTTKVAYLFALGVALGAAKGVRTVYLSLTLPSYVPLERLASASGIQMVFNGIFVISGGTFLGYVRDASGDYKNGIIFLNCVTFLVVLMWSLELILTRRKTKIVQKDEEKSAEMFNESKDMAAHD